MYDLTLQELIALAWNRYVPKNQLQMYDIITGQIRYRERPFKPYDLAPDVVIRIKLPKQKYVMLKKQPDLAQLVSTEFKELCRAFSRAEKSIVSDMKSLREKNNQQQEYIRMFTSLQESQVHYKTCKTVSMHQIPFDQVVEIKSQYLKNSQIDLFSIRLNSIIYILQKHCGLRVRSYIHYERETKQQVLYMFLSLSEGNLLKAAEAYNIKKEIYPSYIDFYINDPCNSDGRPLKFHSDFLKEAQQIKMNKNIGRYFKEPFDFSNKLIVQEKDVSQSLLLNFNSFNESAYKLLLGIKKAKFSYKLSEQEKMLIYNYTNKKNINACLSVFTHQKQKQVYYYLLSKLVNFHHFEVRSSLRTFKKFFIPNKQSKGISFKSKLEALISFVPQIVNSEGQLDYFSRMQRTKLCYRKLKNAFKLDFLNKIDFQLFTLSNDFQKFGNIPQGQGLGYEFTNVVDTWPFHSYFTDICPIRNLTVISMVHYLTSVSMIYIFIFLLGSFNVFKNISAQAIGMVVFIAGFQIFSEYWKELQTEFIDIYSDEKDSQLFLRRYKGPYVRNPTNDQLNQFINTNQATNFIGNFVATLAILGILTLIGLLFFLIRLMLHQLYGSMDQSGFGPFSIAHTLTYSIYYAALTLFKEIFSRNMVQQLVEFINPSTEYHQRKLIKMITFYLILGIQFIGPLFFLVIEPSNKTSCYSNSCISEMQYYISSKYIFITVLNLIQLAYFAFFKRIKRPVPSQNITCLQGKFLKMMESVQIQACKKEFQLDHTLIIIYMIDFAMYCTVVPTSCLQCLIGMLVFHLNMRLKLLYHKRRPIDKSQDILPFSPELNSMYYLGVIFASWILIFGYQVVQTQCVFYLEAFDINTASSIYLTKLVVVVLTYQALLIFGEIIKVIIRIYRGQSYRKRRNKKLKDYENSKGDRKVYNKKIQDSTPLRTIFRTYNDDSIMKKLLIQYLLGRDVNFAYLQSQRDLLKTDF